jgi:hypothetical protein
MRRLSLKEVLKLQNITKFSNDCNNVNIVEKEEKTKSD